MLNEKVSIKYKQLKKKKYKMTVFQLDRKMRKAKYNNSH